MRSLLRSVATRTCLLMAVILSLTMERVSAQPSLQFDSLSYSVSESLAAKTITVVRLGDRSQAVSVEFFTADGVAIAGEDYIPTNGTLTFAAGVTKRTFTVPIIRDVLHEGSDPETVTLQLANPSPNATVGINNATLKIVDDDACTYGLSPTSRTHNWDDAGGSFMLNATAGCTWTVTASTNWVAPAPPGGIGSAVINYSLDQNLSTTQRTATLRIANRTFTVIQRGIPPPDTTRPIVSITAPAVSARVTNLPLIVTGKATDAGGIAYVDFRVENAAGTNDLWTLAENTTNWTASVEGLLPGLNTVRIRAHDHAGNTSVVTRSFNFVVVSPLDLDIDGSGIVTGVRDGQFLDVGKTYTAVAAASPARVNLFACWGGDIATNVPRLTFTMRSNLHLVAKFVPNPFIAVRGSYNGLFQNETPVRHENSGFFTATTTDLGAFSAKVTLAGRVIPFSGRFALDGRATNTILQSTPNPVTVLLQFHFGDQADQITGTLGDGNWSAVLQADRATFHAVTNSPPERGKYTLLISGDGDPSRAPHGYSPGTANIDAAGRVTLSSTLADGSILRQRVPLAKDRRWPLYGRLYGGAGSILGWLRVEDGANDDVNGSITWNKPALPASRLYPNGFTLSTNATGARHATPTNAMDFLLTYTNALVSFSRGNVETPFANAVQVNPGNKVVNLTSNPNKLTLAIAPSSGLFSGTVVVPGSTRSLPFKGALHLKGDYGAGFFAGTNESGRVVIQPIQPAP